MKSPKFTEKTATLRSATESTYIQGDKTSPGSSPGTGSAPKLWLNYSPHSPISNQSTTRTNSLPVTPQCGKPREFWFSNSKTDLESPLLKYPKRKTSVSSLPAHGKALTHQDSPTSSVNSAEFVVPPRTNLPSRAFSTVSSSSDGARRTNWEQKEALRLTGSQNDLQLQAEEKKPIARSWSTNLNIPESNETSENKPDSENEIKQPSRRRRSSIFSLLCVDKDGTCSENNTESDDEEMSGNKQNAEETDDETLQSTSGTHYVEKLYKGIPVGGLASMFEMYKNSGEWGSVKVRFQYFSKSRRFQVSLIRAKNIGHGRKEERLRFFVTVCLMPGKIQRKVGQGFHDIHDPVFYETFNFTKLKLGQIIEKRLKVKFYNKLGLLTKAEPLGELSVPLFNYDLTADTITWLHLRRCGGQTEPNGELDEFDFNLMERDVSSFDSDRKISLYCCSVN